MKIKKGIQKCTDLTPRLGSSTLAELALDYISVRLCLKAACSLSLSVCHEVHPSKSRDVLTISAAQPSLCRVKEDLANQTMSLLLHRHDFIPIYRDPLYFTSNATVSRR